MKQNCEWFELVDELGVFSDPCVGTRAVYKPLLTLMIIARAQQGGENRFGFREIQKELAKYMKAFGQSNKPNSLYPFWYLQNDHYWFVSADGELETRRGKPEPKVSELKQKNAYGHVPKELWHTLASDGFFSAKLAQKLLDDYWPPSIHDDLIAAIGFWSSVHNEDNGERTRDKCFRDDVMIAYNHECAVCGFDGKVGECPFGVEAAHIQARSAKLGNGPDHVTNGIALCSLHHKAFDYGVITLEDDYRIRVSPRLAGRLRSDSAVSKWIRDYQDQNAVVPTGKSGPSPKHLQWHRENVFRA